jgi:hypothetical protein
MNPLPPLVIRFRLCLLLACGLSLLSACHKQAASSGARPELVSSSVTAKKKRLEWNLKTTVGAYEAVGKKNSKWDKAAKAALTEFARARSGALATNEPSGRIIADNLNTAMAAGCDDPLIEYLYVRYGGESAGDAKDRVTELVKVATTMQFGFNYPPIRKFYTDFRAVRMIHEVYGYSNNVPPEMAQFIQANQVPQYVRLVLQDPDTPPEEAFEVCTEVLDANRGSLKNFTNWYGPMEGSMTQNWPDASVTWLLKGIAHTDLAWLARGGGYADAVTEQGWQGFRDQLALARQALEKAWELDPQDGRIALGMIRVAEGSNLGRDVMEQWFGRAMEINPADYEACHAKLHFLYPQWYGSRETMIAFGRECVASDKWRGSVPLILADAHREFALYLNGPLEMEKYWKRPEVWPDIRSSYERFFQLNPDAAGYHHNYAWFAYHCEQWDELNRQLALLGPVNYSYFGGEAAYDKMVAEARAHAK